MLRKWIKNIKWIFNNPPTSITSKPNNPPCDYCGKSGNTWHCLGFYNICSSCQKKVYDKVLKERGEK